MKKAKHSVIGTGENCPKCLIPMERREHSGDMMKQKKSVYYFREWDVCLNCKHLQHYEYLKVFNKVK